MINYHNKKNKEDCNEENKVKKILFNEVSFLIAGVGLISSLIFWVTNPQYEMQMKIIRLESQIEHNITVVDSLERIKNNDFVEIHKKLELLDHRQVQILQAIAKLEAKI